MHDTWGIKKLYKNDILFDKLILYIDVYVCMWFYTYENTQFCASKKGSSLKHRFM